MLERLRSHHEHLRKQVSCERMELYRRASIAMRIALEESEGLSLSRMGAEEGIAVRLLSREGRSGFAASSGSDERSVRWAIDRAAACPATVGAGGWVESGEELEDLDESACLPPAQEMRCWLDEALSRLPDRPHSAWMERAVTVECLVADGGLSSLRSRGRGWAVAWVGSKPLITAGRGLDRFTGEGWCELLADRKRAGGRRGLLFTPESAATLVSALVRSFHADENSLGKPAGPGWRVFDDPRSSMALFGGSFDDAAFKTERRQLANGRRITGTIAGPGNLLRASFRDPPLPLPMHLVVEAGSKEPPGDPIPITDLTIHPLSAGEWAIQVGSGQIRTSPGELIRCCAAAIGPQRLSHNGVLTPALLFEGLHLSQ
jgi:hypothetical protein